MVFAIVLAGFASYDLTQALRKAEFHVPAHPDGRVRGLAMPIAYYAAPAGGSSPARRDGARLRRGTRGAGAALARRSGASLVRGLAAGAFVQGYVTFLATFTQSCSRPPTAGSGGRSRSSSSRSPRMSRIHGFGLAFGKHKMAPVISPKKTWRASPAVPPRAMAGVLLSTLMLGNVVVRAGVRGSDLPHGDRATSSSRS